MIKAIIFDADGTMLDSMKVWENLGERYLLEYHNIKADNELSNILYHMSLEESSIYLKEKYSLKDDEERITKEITDMIRRFYKEEVKPKDGLKEFLSLTNKKGIISGIATSGSKTLLISALKRLKILDYFSVINSCSELNTTKLLPNIYLETAKEMKVSPKNTIVFEDVLHGIKSAKNVGFKTVGVKDKSNAFEFKNIKQMSDIVIEDFNDHNLLKCLFEE